MKSKSLVVLEALQIGIPIELKRGTGTWKMVLIDGELCAEGRLTNAEGKNEFVYMKTDIDLKAFLEMCEQATDEQIVVIQANIAFYKALKKD